jgi:hypothetical protein
MKKNQSPNKVFSISLNTLKTRNLALFDRIILYINVPEYGEEVQEKSSVFPNPYRPWHAEKIAGSCSCRFHFHVRGPDSSTSPLHEFPEFSARNLYNVLALQ